MFEGRIIPGRSPGSHDVLGTFADYLLPLKALSNSADPAPFIASMTRVHAWSAALNFERPRGQVRAQLAACNAFQEDLHTYRLVFP